MQSRERYGMPPHAADMPPFTTAPSRGSTHGGGSGGPANALSHLLGHHQTGTDLSSVHSLHLHGGVSGHRTAAAATTEQQYIVRQQQLELSQQHQQQQLDLGGGRDAQAAASSFLFSSEPQSALHHGHLPSFFRTIPTAAAQQQNTSCSLSHSFFMGGGAATGHSGQVPAPDQFKLFNFNEVSERGEDREEHTPLISSTWSEDESAALIKICSNIDSSSAVASDTALWEEVARKLQEMGYQQRSPRKCKAKFESMPQSYGTVKDKKGSQNQEGEQEFSSEFSSEGGHADDNVDEEDNIEADHETTELITSKKRKVGFSSGSWVPSKAFFERLTREIMEKQESLHMSFLETLERKDRERAMREEAYRRQEAARLDREQEIRAQEISIAACRDAALITFLEKATGQTLIPGLPKMTTQLVTHMIPPRSSTSNGGASTAAAGSDAAALVLQSSDHHLLHNQAEVQDAVDMYNSDLNTKRWPKVEVHALIRLRSGMEPRFREAGPKAHLWQEISTSMACLGFIRSAKRCKEKWENINKYFKKTKDSSKKRPENAKTCPYFHQLDTLYQRGILACSSTSGGTTKALHGKSCDSLTQYDTQLVDESGISRPLMGSDNMQTSDDHRGESAEQQQGRSNEISNDHDMRIMDGTTAQSSIFAAADIYNSNPNSGSGAGTAPSILPFSYQHHHPHRDGSAGGVLMSMPCKKSMQLEMFVKDILDLQQQQHQKLVEEYDRMEQSQELREMERAQQMKAHAGNMVTSHEGPSGTPSHDNATLMALVHKLAGESADISMSHAPSTTSME